MAKKAAGDAAVGLRGTKLIKKAIEAGRSEALSDPEPVASAVLKKMTLPNGEPISASMKELLKVDSLWLGIEFDDEEGDIESVSLEDLIEDELGKAAVVAFGEAIDMFGGDCIALGGASDNVRFLYVGEPDETGEYPVMTLVKEPTPWIGGFVPFDVWVAQELGALEAGQSPGAVPPAYEAAALALATSNGDGRVGFEPKAGEADPDAAEEEDDDDDEEDEEESDADDDSDADGDADAEDADEDDADDEAEEESEQNV